MRAAWEWRGFQPAGDVLLEAAASSTSRLLDLPQSATVLRETDCYLAAPGLAHNLKFRQGALEIKRLRRRAGEYSLWADKERWPLPLPDHQADVLRHLLGLPAWTRLSCPPVAEALFAELRQHLPALSMVAVAKQRVRFDTGRVRWEVACLTMPDGTRWLSYCADGYELSAVKQIVAQARPGGLRVMSYVDFLQATDSRDAAGRGVWVLHGEQAP